MEEELSQLRPIVPEKPSPIIGGVVCEEDPNLLWVNLVSFMPTLQNSFQFLILTQ